MAARLEPLYHDKNCAVVALSDGGVVVGAQIAAALHCVMMLLMVKEINLPSEPDPLAAINQEGGTTYNNMFSEGQLDEFRTEYHSFIEQTKLEKIHEMNRILGAGGIIRKDLLKQHSVILVADGLPTGYSLDAAVDFLKPVKMERLVVATPLAGVSAVDRMHLAADEICCLSVVENYMTTDHYYEDNHLPDHETIIKTIKHTVENWEDITSAGNHAPLIEFETATTLQSTQPKGKVLPEKPVPSFSLGGRGSHLVPLPQKQATQYGWIKSSRVDMPVFRKSGRLRPRNYF